MHNGPTQPRIFETQNNEDTRRLVAAQARMYSDAKLVSGARLWFVTGLAVAAGFVAVAFPSLRTGVGGWGGAAVLVLSFAAGAVEKRLRFMAAMTQELFDTRVFQLDWNGVLAERPPAARVAKAALRYKGGRDANWYDDTENMHRPYDVLTCQASNLGWGASMHRLWGYLLCVAISTLVILCFLLAWLTGLTWGEMIPAIVIPAMTPTKELIEQARANFSNARGKEAAERKISDLWAEGMSGKSTPSEHQLRAIQDKILQFRQENAFVPDWLDSIFHRRNEAAMRASVQSRLEEARRSHLA
jgi:hypothetical protein